MTIFIHFTENLLCSVAVDGAKFEKLMKIWIIRIISNALFFYTASTFVYWVIPGMGSLSHKRERDFDEILIL